jgi:RNA polymerase primary sigma factor
MAESKKSTPRKATRAKAPGAGRKLALVRADDGDLLDLYIAELSRMPVLSAEAQKELARCSQDTGRTLAERAEARGSLIRANLRFAFAIAKQFQNRGVALEDLVSEANAGLVHAADKYDPDVGVNFISYAVWWIRQSLSAAVTRHGHVVRVPLSRSGVQGRITTAQTLLRERLGRDPTDEEIAQVASLTIDAVKSVRPLLQHERSFDEPLAGGKGDRDRHSLADVLTADDEVAAPLARLEEESLRDTLTRALEAIPPRDREVLELYYGLSGDDPMTLNQIAERLHVSRERIRQLRDRALDTIRSGAAGDALRGEWAA